MELRANIIIGFIAIVLIVGLISRPKLIIEKLFVLLFVFALLAEILATKLLVASNLDIYSLSIFIEFILLAYIINLDINKPWLSGLFSILLGVEVLMQVFGRSSGLSWITNSGTIDSMVLQRTVMFFDLAMLNGLLLTLLMFYWIWWTVNANNLSKQEIIKRYWFSFSALVFYCGSFFSLAIPRLVMPDFADWSGIMAITFVPLFSFPTQVI